MDQRRWSVIDHIMVKWTAEKHLRDTLREMPHVADYIINDKSTWNTWIDRLTQRLRECDDMGWIRSKNALLYAIESWTTHYALKRLEKTEFAGHNPKEPA